MLYTASVSQMAPVSSQGAFESECNNRSVLRQACNLSKKLIPYHVHQ